MSDLVEQQKFGKVSVLWDRFSTHRFIGVEGYGFRRISPDTFLRFNSVDPKVRDEGVLELIHLAVDLVEDGQAS